MLGSFIAPGRLNLRDPVSIDLSSQDGVALAYSISQDDRAGSMEGTTHLEASHLPTRPVRTRCALPLGRVDARRPRRRRRPGERAIVGLLRHLHANGLVGRTTRASSELRHATRAAMRNGKTPGASDSASYLEVTMPA